MVKAGPEEDSNSQNDKYTIKDIDFYNNRCFIVFSEGLELILNKKILLDINLQIGYQLTLIEIEQIKNKSRKIEVETESIKLVSRYLHSKYLLKLKLLKRGFEKSIVESVITELDEAGIINDTQYATNWILSRIESHPESSTTIYYELKKRGIDKNLIKTAISEVYTSDIEIKCIKESIMRKLKKGNYNLDEIKKFLSTKGFSNELIKKTIDDDEFFQKQKLN